MLNKFAIGTVDNLINGRGEFWADMDKARQELQNRLTANPTGIYVLCQYVSLTELVLVEIVQTVAPVPEGEDASAEYQAEIDRLNRIIADLQEELDAAVMV